MRKPPRRYVAGETIPCREAVLLDRGRVRIGGRGRIDGSNPLYPSLYASIILHQLILPQRLELIEG
jgi:hypothetical protein